MSSSHWKAPSQDQRGFSLIEMLVALGILSIIVLAFMTLVQNQNKEIKAIDEKMEMQGLQTQLMNVLSSPAFCGCFIGGNTFNYTARTWNGFPALIGASYDGSCALVGAPWVNPGTRVGSLLPTALSMQDITETTAGSGNFSGNLVIEFDQSILTRSRKPISVPMYFKVDTTVPANSTLISCSSGGTGGGAAAIPYDPVAACAEIGGFYDPAATPHCNPTYK